MLPETRTGRRAESAQAGGRSLQTQTRGDGAGAAGKVPGVCPPGADAGRGPSPGARGPHYLCRERSPGHGAHRTLVPTVGWAAPGLFCPRL